MISLSRIVALFVLSSLLLSLAPASAGEEGKRALTLEDLYRVQSPGGPDLSPDGSFLVYSLRSTDLAQGSTTGISTVSRWRAESRSG